ncbi:MAG: hypothetical protein AAB594_00495 [Patescibacteria group bacterium]
MRIERRNLREALELADQNKGALELATYLIESVVSPNCDSAFKKLLVNQVCRFRVENPSEDQKFEAYCQICSLWWILVPVWSAYGHHLPFVNGERHALLTQNEPRGFVESFFMWFNTHDELWGDQVQHPLKFSKYPTSRIIVARLSRPFLDPIKDPEKPEELVSLSPLAIS